MFPADSILSASVTRAQPSNWIITAMSLTSPKLWVVATPLGNPGDLSPRAREVLEGADMVLAEDTRRAGLLCQRCGVKAKRFMSFHDHNEESKLDEVLGLLNGGRTLALISDAGLPLVADRLPAGPGLPRGGDSRIGGSGAECARDGARRERHRAAAVRVFGVPSPQPLGSGKDAGALCQSGIDAYLL